MGVDIRLPEWLDRRLPGWDLRCARRNDGRDVRGERLLRAVKLSKRIRRRSIEMRLLGLVALAAVLLDAAILVFGATGVLCDRAVPWPGDALCQEASDTAHSRLTLVLTAGASLVTLVVREPESSAPGITVVSPGRI